MNKQHIKYLIKMLREDGATMRAFWKKFPEAKKQAPDSVAEYKFQKEILKSLKQTLIED